MPSILDLITPKDRLDFSQNFSIQRPDYLGDRFFPDVKTENLMAEYIRLSQGAEIPRAAMVHGFNTEAEIGTRPTAEIVTIEKLFIKEKLDQGERVRLWRNRGVSSDSAIIDYIFNDMRIVAEAVKTRAEAAKMEVLSNGSMTVKENHLDFKVDYGVPAENVSFAFDWSSPDADIVGDIQKVVDKAILQGKTLTGILTSRKQLSRMKTNKAIQVFIYGSAGAGTLVTDDRLRSVMQDLFGFSRIDTDDRRYSVQRANGQLENHRYYPENKVTFYTEISANGGMGTGLWGVTPEETAYGPFTEKSQQQFITVTQWETPDPVTTWTKASGVFIPVLPDPYGLFIATADSNSPNTLLSASGDMDDLNMPQSRSKGK